MKTTVFWTEDYPRPADLPTNDLPETIHVAVIGSGYTGLNAAIALRKAGASVVVLEQESIGWGASSRNGGMALTGLKEEMPVVFKRYGAGDGACALAVGAGLGRLCRAHRQRGRD